MPNELKFISLNIPNDNRATSKEMNSFLTEEQLNLQYYYHSYRTENLSQLRDTYFTNKHSYYKMDALRLANCLTFHFDDATAFNIFELFNYKVSHLLPSDLLPKNLEKPVNVKKLIEDPRLNIFLNSLFLDSRTQDFYILANAVLAVLENIFKINSKKNFKVYLSSGFNPQGGTIKLLPLTSVILGHETKEELVLEPTESSFNETRVYRAGFSFKWENLNSNDSEEIYRINNSTYDFQKKELTLRPILKSQIKIKNQLEYMDIKFLALNNKISVNYFSDLNPIINWLNKEQISFKYCHPPQAISSEKATPILILNTTQSPFEVTFAIKAEGQLNSFYIMNLLQDIKYFSNGFTYGLSTFFYEDRTYLASGKRNLKREMDLKFLRHRGVFSLVLLETINCFLNELSSDGSPLKSQAQLIEYLNIKCALLLKNDKQKLNQIISKKVYSTLKLFITTMLQKLTSIAMKFTSPGEIVHIEREKYFVAQFLKVLLESYLSIDKGMAALKITAKESETLVHSLVTRSADVLLLQELPGPSAISVNKAISSYLRKDHLQKIELDDKHGIEFLKNLPYLLNKGWQVVYDNQDVVSLTADDFDASIEFNDDNLDWFELHPKVFFNGIDVNINEFKFQESSGMILFKGKFYLLDPKSLPKIKSLERFWKKLTNKTQQKLSEGEKDFYRLPKSEILELLSLYQRGVKVESNSLIWNKILNYYLNLNTHSKELFISKKLAKTLKPYQVEGVNWINDLYQLQLGGVLADDMGLGKTLQALTFLEHLSNEKIKDLRNTSAYTSINTSKTSNLSKLNLIVVPTSLVYNWLSEAKKFTPDLNIVHFNSQKKNTILNELSENKAKSNNIIITYGVLCENIEWLKKIKWKVIIFDEAQYLKNLSAYRTTCARQLTADFKLALTGTPLENNFIEFYSIADLVLPGCLGSYELFNQIYGANKTLIKEDIDDLKLKIKPIILRRTKDKLNIKLPKKNEEAIIFDFENEQLEIYKKLALSHNNQINELILTQGEAKTQLAMLTALLRLRQTCSDPNGIPQIIYNKIPPKLDHLVESIKELVDNNQSVLIFTQFLTTMDKINSLMQKADIKCLCINGSVPQNKRKLILEEFESHDKPMALVMTLKTGGVGLNLTKASTVFHVEPWWNPAVENQATDRVHRLGQTKNVNVYRLIMKNSVEEKIELLKARKKGFFDSLFSESEEISTTVSGRLTKEDFLFLIQ